MLSAILFDLTLEEVLASIPRDASSILVYALLALFVALIWAGNRGGSGAEGSGGGDHER